MKNKKSIIPLEKALSSKECEAFLKELGPSWTLLKGAQLKKEYLFKNFIEALAFVNAAGQEAENCHHHPDLLLSYGKVTAFLSTHSVSGLSKKDFDLAEKLDALYIAKTLHE